MLEELNSNSNSLDSVPPGVVISSLVSWLTVLTTLLFFCWPPASERYVVRMGERAITSKLADICCVVLWTQ